jgi:hypothetical protein
MALRVEYRKEGGYNDAPYFSDLVRIDSDLKPLGVHNGIRTDCNQDRGSGRVIL